MFKQFKNFVLFLLLSAFFTHSSYAFSLDELNHLKPHYLPIKQGRLEYFRFGHGSPIVLIEGYATDLSSWNTQFLAILAEQHELIVFNNREVGGSYVRSSHYESKDLAQDTYQLITGLHLKNPAILGISMGGMIAQQLAVLYPDKIGELILINTAIAGSKSIEPNPDVQKLLLHLPQNQLDRYITDIRLFIPPSWFLSMGLSLIKDRFLPSGYASYCPSNQILILQQRLVKHWMKDNAAGQQIEKLTMPTLIINGGADTVIPPINSDILAKSILHSRLIRFDDAGHAITYQYPQEIAREINNFLHKRQDPLARL